MYILLLYCHVYQWLRRGFGLVIWFINHLQVVTTINYYTITDFHTTKHSTLISSVYLH
jgi:type IV secretory pathway TrbD component